MLLWMLFLIVRFLIIMNMAHDTVKNVQSFWPQSSYMKMKLLR